MNTDFDQIERMADAEQSAFVRQWATAFASDQGDTAREILAAGLPIYYTEADTPDDQVIRQMPDGTRQLVRWSGDIEVVVRELTPA